jgi:hypothetical protein
VSPTCTICVTDRRRRQARSVQSVFRRNTRLSASAFASDAFWTVEPLMTTAALNRPLARGDFSRVHTEVPPDTGGPKHTRFITQLSTINYHHHKSPLHQYITKTLNVHSEIIHMLYLLLNPRLRKNVSANNTINMLLYLSLNTRKGWTFFRNSY